MSDGRLDLINGSWKHASACPPFEMDEVQANADGTYTALLRLYDPGQPEGYRLGDVQWACSHRHRVGRQARECGYRQNMRRRGSR